MVTGGKVPLAPTSNIIVSPLPDVDAIVTVPGIGLGVPGATPPTTFRPPTTVPSRTKVCSTELLQATVPRVKRLAPMAQ
jgi:hypothetical protein